MNFLDGSLYTENQEKLVITAAPYGPEWFPSDFPEDIPVTMEEQIQKAVDCYNAGASVLHLHVRELDGKGSKRLSKFNELIAGVRAAVPDMVSSSCIRPIIASIFTVGCSSRMRGCAATVCSRSAVSSYFDFGLGFT